MGKKRLLALMCAVSILLTTFMPLSALGDEGVGELIVTAAPTEEVVAYSEAGTEPAETNAVPTAEPTAIPEPTTVPVETPTATATATHEQGQVTPEPTQDNSTPAPTLPPLPSDTEWQVFNDRSNAIWQNEMLTFTINVSGLDANSIICMYDADKAVNISNIGDISNYIIAATPGYWNWWNNTYYTANQLLTYLYNNDMQREVWQLLNFQPQGSGTIKYGWRVYAADANGNMLKADGSIATSINDAYYHDYAASEGSSVTIYTAPTVQVNSINPNMTVNAGTAITLSATTSNIVDDIVIVDENGNKVGYLESKNCRDEGNFKRWTCVFKLYEPKTYHIGVLASATVGGSAKTVLSTTSTINVPADPSQPTPPVPTPDDGGNIPTQEPSQITSGAIRAANVPSDSVVPGMKATMSLNIEYAMSDGTRINYTDINFFNYVDYVEIWPEVTGSDFPFEAKDVEHILIKKDDLWVEQSDGTYKAKSNPAKFSFTMRARSDLANGNYPVNFAIRYKLKDQDEQQVNNAVIGMLFIFGADAPNPTQEPSPTAKPDLGYVRFIQIPSISARAGDTVHLDMGVEFAASDGKRYSYTDADFYKYVDYIEIQPEITDTYPFVADGNINRKIIHSQSEALSSPFTYDMQVKSTLGAGTHTFNFTLRYRLKGSTSTEPDKTETCMLFVSEPAQPTVDPQAGYVRFAQMPNANAKVGESLTLDLGVEFASSDGQRFSYTDPEFYKYVDYIEIQPEITDNYPFVVTDELSRKIIRSLEDAQTNPFTYGVQVKKSLTNGAYTFNFTLRYRLKGKAEPEADKTEAGMVFVTGAKTPGSGGGGGGGGTVLPNPQAKLIVDSLSTNPSAPKAGDTFDINLVLKNTNEKQYIQNVKVSYTVDNDVLLPANGSSSFYIPKIEAGATYELVVPVSARPDMPDSPVKMNLTMEYEDKKVSSVSANQVVILNVKQVQKIKLDQLVLPQGEVLVGESASFTMNIINSGRTTLYNVSAAMLDNDMFTTGGSSYIGNLEAGASKQMELDIYPNAEGAIDGTVRVTYEDANGNQQYEDVPYSIYASPVDDGSDDINNPIIEPTPEPTYEISNILENLPWWVYGAAGLFVICIVMLLAVAAHRRKAASMMDYDDD